MPDADCSDVLKALSDETRWGVVKILLEEGRAKVTDLAGRLSVPQPTMSKHLRMLREAGIVVSEKERTIVWCEVSPDFTQRLRDGKQMLDMGCCTFRFDKPKKN
ncbi:MAG: winged helix-turn-helix transcriptional regulator [Verrucomicrobiaceae bacterium]|nr:winged helix-turn-helix transcriptional regulator [Verrucomicrobiaceae bacterium]